MHGEGLDKIIPSTTGLSRVTPSVHIKSSRFLSDRVG